MTHKKLAIVFVIAVLIALATHGDEIYKRMKTNHSLAPVSTVTVSNSGVSNSGVATSDFVKEIFSEPEVSSGTLSNEIIFDKGTVLNYGTGKINLIDLFENEKFAKIPNVDKSLKIVNLSGALLARDSDDFYFRVFYYSGYVDEYKKTNEFVDSLSYVVKDIMSDPVKFEKFKKNLNKFSDDFEVVTIANQSDVYPLFQEYLDEVDDNFYSAVDMYSVSGYSGTLTAAVADFEGKLKNKEINYSPHFDYSKSESYQVGLALKQTIKDVYSDKLYDGLVKPYLTKKIKDPTVSAAFYDDVQSTYDVISDGGVGPSGFGDESVKRFNTFGKKVFGSEFKEMPLETEESFKETLKNGETYIDSLLAKKNTEIELLKYVTK